MLYREAGQFKTTYAADQQLFPIRQDRIGIAILLAVVFVGVPLAAATPAIAAAIDFNYWFSGVLIPFLIFSLAALGLNILTGYAGQLSLGTAAFMAVAAKNMVRSSIGRAWMAVRDMDVAAEVVGIPMMKTKLLAFAISSFYCGVAGALYAFAYLGTVEPAGFELELSFRILFMIIV